MDDVVEDLGSMTPAALERIANSGARGLQPQNIDRDVRRASSGIASSSCVA